MQQCFEKLRFLAGDIEILRGMSGIKPLVPFSGEVIGFLDAAASIILKSPEARKFPDVYTFGFWIRKGSIERIKRDYSDLCELSQGRGVAFHIAPSNVAVNFAYSMASGLISGNANVVRLPSKDFEQTRLICGAIHAALDKFPKMRGYIALVQYERDGEINDGLSAMCDTRIVWGGDETIRTIRKSPLPPRAKEINFADRYSVCAINSDKYIESRDFTAVAEGFYNDTFLTDQNACSSPKLVVWLGGKCDEAQAVFWPELGGVVRKKAYEISPAQAVQKLGMQCELAMGIEGVRVSPNSGGFLTLMKLDRLSGGVMRYCGHSGFFMEYDAESLNDILPVCGEKCQTLVYYGFEKDEITSFLRENCPEGIDRAVPIGKAMEFSLIWDGYDLVREMTRIKQVG